MAITVADLNNAERDVDHIAAVATSTANSSIDRLGNTKKTLHKVLADADASVASTLVSLTENTGNTHRDTLAQLNSYLAPKDGAGGIVSNDPDPAKNGWYRKIGASGSGSWARLLDQPARESQVNEILSGTGKNLIDPGQILAGYRYGVPSNQFEANAQSRCTGYIPIVPGQTYTASGWPGTGGGSMRGGFFAGRGDINSIGELNSPNAFTFTAPGGANFIVINIIESGNQSDTSYDGTIQLELGGQATSYEPFARLIPMDKVSGVDARFGALEERVDELPPDYVRNYLANGNLANASPDWVYTGTASVVSVAATPVLAELGVERAYSIPQAGSVSQVRLSGALLDGLGIAQGDHLLVGSLVYAANGSSFPSSLAGYTYTIGGNLTTSDTSGYVQLSSTLRFYWGKKAIASDLPTLIIIGFTGSGTGFPAAATTRYHTGFYVHRSTEAIATPTAATFPAYTGWQGQGTLEELFAKMETLPARVTALESSTPDFDAAPAKVVLAGSGESYIEVKRGPHIIRRTFLAWPTTTLTAPNNFDFRRDIIDGVTIKTMTDDVAPYRMFGGTIGANHGYSMTRITAVGHGKVQGDVGSVYTLGGNEYVLVGIESLDMVYMTARSAQAAVPTGTLVHISGGVSSTNIVGSAAASRQMYPPSNNRVVRVLVDGIEVDGNVAALAYRREVVIMESYDILPKNDIAEWYVSTGGAGLVPEGNAAASVSISYSFDTDGNCTIYSDFLALQSGVALQDIMFAMTVTLDTGVDGPINYYIPKALPVVHGSQTLDYANIDSADTSAWPTRLDFTPSRCEPDGILVDRVIQLSDNYGFAIGYLPVQGAAPDVRRTNATVKALQINDTLAKVYLSCIDSGTQTLTAGDYFSAVCYRNLILRDPARTSCYAVRTPGADYLYADWHAPGMDRVPVPADFAGRAFEVVEASDNVTVLSQQLTGSLAVDVDSGQSYGYLILKVL